MARAWRGRKLPYGTWTRANHRRAARRDTIACMKRTLAWFAGLVGIAALGRMLSRRRNVADNGVAVDDTPVVTDADDPADNPAEELRRKLAEQRDTAPAAVQDTEPEAAVESLDERRARVHAKAREAMDAMHDDGSVA